MIEKLHIGTLLPVGISPLWNSSYSFTSSILCSLKEIVFLFIVHKMWFIKVTPICSSELSTCLEQPTSTSSSPAQPSTLHQNLIALVGVELFPFKLWEIIVLFPINGTFKSEIIHSSRSIHWTQMESSRWMILLINKTLRGAGLFWKCNRLIVWFKRKSH